MADIFISYKREEKEIANKFVELFQQAGFTVWWDDRINPASSWDETIEREITEAAAVVVLWSPLSVSSEWVRTEAHFASNNKKLVPAQVKNCTIPLAFTLTQAAQLQQWKGDPNDRQWVKCLTWVKDLVTAKKRLESGEASATEAAAWDETMGELPGGEKVMSGIRIGVNSAPGTAFRDIENGPVMRVIPEGRFKMGSPDSEIGRRENEGPHHWVNILEPFAIGVYPLTFEEWDLIAPGRVDHSPFDEGWGRGNRPVINVSWEDARAFVDALCGVTGEHYRLPSEAEWEYCARAGSKAALPEGDFDRSAYCIRRQDQRTQPVGFAQPNAFGLVDMIGNVREWTEDLWHNNYVYAHPDGAAWTSGDGSMRVVRGASWQDNTLSARFAARFRGSVSQRAPMIGIRLARDLD